MSWEKRLEITTNITIIIWAFLKLLAILCIGNLIIYITEYIDQYE